MKSKPSTRLQDLGERLFSYAVIADTHVNHAEQETNSVYPVNRLHNPRLRHVVRELNRRDAIDFVIHLGDLVHPVPAIPHLFAEAAQRFRELMNELRCPLYLVPGNHDVGDKPCDWTPAVPVREAFVDLYREHFGDDYHAFEHKGIQFVQLNVQLLNSGLEAEREQREWFESWLSDHRDERIVLNIHYPVFLTERSEDSHYDNLDEPGRSWLLDLLERHSVEALFAGHVHNFWYHRFAATECYYLPSTAFVRQDYSETARTPPATGMQGGRDDAEKLGYFVVRVHRRGHYCEFRRTGGIEATPDSSLPAGLETIEGLHPIANRHAALGFDMRQDWLETVQVPPSGGVDEFNRKIARNDYPLMSLWEMGVRRLRIPKMDVLDPVRRERIAALRGHGLEFTLCSYGPPELALERVLRDHPGLIEAWEIHFPWDDLDRLLPSIKPIHDQTGVDLFLARLRGKDDHADNPNKYVHAVNSGFTPEDRTQIAQIAALGWVRGVVFRIAGNAPVYESLSRAHEVCLELGLEAAATLRMSTLSPADVQGDDLWAASRVAEALASGIAHPRMRVFVDTFADIDRGYFRRHGVVDRLYNPRLGFHVIKHLYAALDAEATPCQRAELRATDQLRVLSLRQGDRPLALVMPQATGASFEAVHDLIGEIASPATRCLDLVSGGISSSETTVGHRAVDSIFLLSF